MAAFVPKGNMTDFKTKENEIEDDWSEWSSTNLLCHNCTEEMTNLSKTRRNVDSDSLVLTLTILQVMFIIFGIILKLMIVYFEHFGRDSQKRSLVNRVNQKCTSIHII